MNEDNIWHIGHSSQCSFSAKRTLIVAFVVAIISCCMFLISESDESSADSCDDVSVYILDENDTYQKSVVSDVQTVKEAIEKAMTDQGRKMVLNTTQTEILSIDERIAPSENSKYWRIFQLRTNEEGIDWTIKSFNEISDSSIQSGSVYCVTISEYTEVDGVSSYSVPNFKPEWEGYIFIRFATEPEDTEHLDALFDKDVRQTGFWLKSHGANVADILRNAVNELWPNEADVYYDENTFSAVRSLFGLTDVMLEPGGASWSWWVGSYWNGESWQFPQRTWQSCGPEYQFVSFIYGITYGVSMTLTPENTPGFNPESENITPAGGPYVVDFQLPNGTSLKKITVPYGKRIAPSEIPIPTEEGKGFVGWGEISKPVVSNMTRTATFTDIDAEMVCITYLAETGQLIHKEYVTPGSSATYDQEPTKLGPKEFLFIFEKWSEDLSAVSEDISVTPVFKKVQSQYRVHIELDGQAFCDEKHAYGEVIQLDDLPTKEHYVGNWQSSDVDIVDNAFTLYNDVYIVGVYTPVSYTYTVNYVNTNGEQISEPSTGEHPYG